MRIRWQLALAGGLLALLVVALGSLYVGGGTDPSAPTRRPGDLPFILLAACTGVLAGLAVSRWLERPLSDLTREVRSAGATGDELNPGLASSVPNEFVSLYRAIRDLHSKQTEVVSAKNDENRRLHVILDSITEGILVTDGDGRILLANNALRELFDIRHAIDGRMPVEVVRNATVGDAIDGVLAGGTPTTCEMTVGSAPRSLDIHVAPITDDESARPVGTVTVFYEITRLRRLERMRVDFVANVSHELRTPLTAIKGCAETLQDGALKDAEAATRFVGVIANHADRLTGLLEDLLDLSRLESDGVELDLATVPVQRLVDTAREAVAQSAASKQITVAVDIPDGLTVTCDRPLIEQALINLVDNAVKYTPDGGDVSVRATQMTRAQSVLQLAQRRWSGGGVEHVGDEGHPQDVVVLEVVDTGIGIPSSDVARVFERFYRVDKGRSRAMGGTGLGLSIVRHVIELHGERAFVDSDLGGGSVFGFTLPAA